MWYIKWWWNKKFIQQHKKDVGTIHGIVHSIAQAKAEDLKSDYINTSRDGFAHALDVSAYSLVAICREANEIMEAGGSIVTLTYVGADKIIPGYNVMGVAKAALECSVRYLAHDMGKSGIRVNAISAGPIKTISAKGVADFGKSLEIFRRTSLLGPKLSISELGDSAVMLLSELSRAVTGEIVYVDCGSHLMGI